MSRIALTRGDVTRKNLRRRFVPIGTTIAASLLVLLPFVLTTPYVPDFGYLVFISWRLLRPEMWSAKTSLGLGFFDDLVSGQPLGQAMALWTITMLILDFIESRAFFRDFWMDWLLASCLILFHTFGSWLVALLMGSDTEFSVLWPQLALSILAYPVIARMVVMLDRWRLTR
jgi:rod shape-determining protein MreD